MVSTKTHPAAPSSEERVAAYSFDLFDTCITRSHAYPRDLFYDLGLRLAGNSLDRAGAAKFARRFQAGRIRAERCATRDVRPHECPTIHEIYARLSPIKGLRLDAEALVALEVEMEQESIYPVASMVEHIRDLRDAGNRIIFISDMYLPATMLRPILKDAGLIEDADALYVSCDARLTKHSGNLYRHVLEKEGLSPSQVVHTGDNAWSDIRVAANMGIRCRQFEDTGLSHLEASLAGRSLPRESHRSTIAALSRRSRLSVGSANGSRRDADAVIHSVIAPFLIAYVQWVLDHAAKAGICRLYFVARDGEVLYRIAQKLRGPGAPELRYLHGSRRAWLSPSIRHDAHGWQRLLITAGQSNGRHDVLARAGLTPSQQTLIRSHLGYSPEQWEEPLSEVGAHDFLAAFLSDPDASKLLYDMASGRRAIAMEYLRQQGLCDRIPWALVDAGWALNSQAALKRILLDDSHASSAVRGYYIALTRDHLPEAEAGIAHAFISPSGSIFSRRRVVIEHCFTPSTHATTQSYETVDGSVSPLLGAEIRSTSELDYATRLQAICEHMAHATASSAAYRRAFEEGRAIVIANAERFLCSPSRSEAAAMAQFGTVADLRHERNFVKPLCRSLRFSDLTSILGMTFSRGERFRRPSFMWLEGSASLSPAYLRLPVKAMLLADKLRNSVASLRWRHS